MRIAAMIIRIAEAAMRLPFTEARAAGRRNQSPERPVDIEEAPSKGQRADATVAEGAAGPPVGVDAVAYRDASRARGADYRPARLDRRGYRRPILAADALSVATAGPRRWRRPAARCRPSGQLLPLDRLLPRTVAGRHSGSARSRGRHRSRRDRPERDRAADQPFCR